MSTETNCFKICGSQDLKTECRLFQIVGLSRDSTDYFGNIQRIIRQLSFQMKAPVTTYDRADDTFLVVAKGFADPHSNISLVDAVAAIRDVQETLNLTFDAGSPELDAVRIRFLQ